MGWDWITEPAGDLWDAVKRNTIDQVWPPDSEQDAWDLADQLKALGKTMNEAADALEAQAAVSETVWLDVAGVQYTYLLRKLPESFRVVGDNMAALGDGAKEYGDSLREARINIIVELAANVALYGALMAFGPAGGFLAQGLARAIAGRLTTMVSSLIGRTASGGLSRALGLASRLGVEMGKEAIDEVLIDTTTQLASMAMNTRDDFDFGRVGKAAATGAVGGLLGEGVGKLMSPMTRATNAGLGAIMPPGVARNITAGVSSAANNAVTSPTASYLVENYDNPGALGNLEGYGNAIKQNGAAAAITGAPRAMVIDHVQQMHPNGQQLVDDLVNRSSGNAPATGGNGQVSSPDLRGGEPAGGTGGSGAGSGGGAGAGSGGGQTGGNAPGGNPGTGGAGSGQTGGAPAGGEAGGAQTGGGQSGAGGGQAGGAQTGAGTGGEAGGTQTGGAQSGAGNSGTQTGEAEGAQTGAGTGGEAGGTQTGGAQSGAGNSGAQTGEASGAQTGEAGGAQTGGAEAGGAQTGTGTGGAEAGGAQTGAGNGGAQAGEAGGAQAGAGTGGAETGGTQTGGAQSGGAQSGAGTGGAEAGGAQTGTGTGGSQAGGTQAGGTQAGGQTGGTQAGGAQSGAETGGTQAGEAQSGTGTGGAETGGAQAGAGTGGAETGGAQTGSQTGGESGSQAGGAQTGEAGSQTGGSQANGESGSQTGGEAGSSQQGGAQSGDPGSSQSTSPYGNSESGNAPVAGDPGQSGSPDSGATQSNTGNQGASQSGQTVVPMGAAPAAGAAPTHTSVGNAGAQTAGVTGQSSGSQASASQAAPATGQSGNSSAQTGSAKTGKAGAETGSTEAQSNGSSQSGKAESQTTAGANPSANNTSESSGTTAASAQPTPTRTGGTAALAAAVPAAASLAAGTSPANEQRPATAKPTRVQVGSPPSGRGTNSTQNAGQGGTPAGASGGRAGGNNGGSGRTGASPASSPDGDPEISAKKIKKIALKTGDKTRAAEKAAKEALAAAAKARDAVRKALAAGTEAAAKEALKAVKESANQSQNAERNAYLAEAAADKAEQLAEKAARQTGGRVSETDIQLLRDAATNARQAAEKAMDAALEAWLAATPDRTPPPVRAAQPEAGDPNRQPDDPSITFQPEVHLLGTFSADRLTVEDGVITEIDGQPVEKKLRELSKQRAEVYFRAKLLKNPSGVETGDVVAVVLNVRTGQVFESTNGQKHTEITPASHVHPKLRAHEEQLRRPGHYPQWNDDGTPAPGETTDLPGLRGEPLYRHAEVRAANEHLHANEDVELSDLLADVWFTQTNGPVLAPFCANCSGVLPNVRSLSGRREYSEDGGQRLNTLPPELPDDPPEAPPSPSGKPPGGPGRPPTQGGGTAATPAPQPAQPSSPATPPSQPGPASGNSTATRPTPSGTGQTAPATTPASPPPTTPANSASTTGSTPPAAPPAGATPASTTPPSGATTPSAIPPAGATSASVTPPSGAPATTPPATPAAKPNTPTTSTPTGPATAPAAPAGATPPTSNTSGPSRSAPPATTASQPGAAGSSTGKATPAAQPQAPAGASAASPSSGAPSSPNPKTPPKPGAATPSPANPPSGGTTSGTPAGPGAAPAAGSAQPTNPNTPAPNPPTGTTAAPGTTPTAPSSPGSTSPVSSGTPPTGPAAGTTPTSPAPTGPTPTSSTQTGSANTSPTSTGSTPAGSNTTNTPAPGGANTQNTQAHTPGAPNSHATSPQSAPPKGLPTGTRSRVEVVRYARFAVARIAHLTGGRVMARVRVAMGNTKIWGDAGIREATPSTQDSNEFDVTRADGTHFTVKVVSENLDERSLAEVEVITTGNEVHILISPRVKLNTIDRVVADAVAQASEILLAGARVTDDVLRRDVHPGDHTTLSVADRGREAEVRNLDRAAEEARRRVVRRQRVAREMQALVEHLGMHSEDPVAPQRNAISTVGGDGSILEKHAGKRRPAWALPPNGYPTWKVFFTVHLLAEVSPGTAAGIAILNTGGPLVLAEAVWAATAVSGITGTFAKQWYGLREKIRVDTGHGINIKKRADERAKRRRKHVDEMLEHTRAAGISDDPKAEPETQEEIPTDKPQSWLARFTYRSLPAVNGSLTGASFWAFGSLPVWNAIAYGIVAGASTAFGPWAEKYGRRIIASQELAKLDNIGRAQDNKEAEIDEMFVALINEVFERLDNLAGGTPNSTSPIVQRTGEQAFMEPRYRNYLGNQVLGQSGDTARAGMDAAGKTTDAVPFQTLAEIAGIGLARTVANALLNMVVDKHAIKREYDKIKEQVTFDFGNRTAEQLAIQHRILTEMLNVIVTNIVQEEARANVVNTTPAGEVSTDVLPKVSDDPETRPVGRQGFKAFGLIHAIQAAGILVPVAIATPALDQPTSGLIVVGAVAGAVLGSFPNRWALRRNEQDRVDTQVLYGRDRERPNEHAEAEALLRFAIDFGLREIQAAINGQTTRNTPPSPRTPSNPSDPTEIGEFVDNEYTSMLNEPRPVKLLAPRLVALERMTRIANRVRVFEAHERDTGNSKPVKQARADLVALYEAYQTMLDDTKPETYGEPLPADDETLLKDVAERKQQGKPQGFRGGEPGTRTAGDLQSYLDQSVVTPAGRAYYAPGDEMLDVVADVRPEPGWYTIDMHGNPDSVRIGADLLTVEDLATLMEMDPNWHGEPIRLLACETGKRPDGFAQQLGDRLGVTVKAPPEHAGVGPDGEVIVTVTEVGPDGIVRPVMPPTSRMYVFEPTARPGAEPAAAAPEPPRRPRAPTRPPLPSAVRHGLSWPHHDDVRIGEMREMELVEEIGELALLRSDPTVYTGAERLWPDELANIVAESGDWTGGPARIQIREGHVDPEFVQRFADLLGVPVLINSSAVAGDFATLSSGTLEVYNEPSPVETPAGAWRVYEPRNVVAGKEMS